MQVKWGRMAVKVTIWLAAELLLNVVGLDNLADYSEFLFGEQTLTQPNSSFPIALVQTGSITPLLF